MSIYMCMMYVCIYMYMYVCVYLVVELLVPYLLLSNTPPLPLTHTYLFLKMFPHIPPNTPCAIA